jgi:DNA-binding NtrC family response regulator
MARILVIEDEDGLRRILVRTLEAAGHTVLGAREGKEALQLHQRFGTELVVTDLFMPEMDGMEVLLAIHKKSPDLKVIAISGGGKFFNPAEALENAQALGAHAGLDKPFELWRFLETVENALAA